MLPFLFCIAITITPAFSDNGTTPSPDLQSILDRQEQEILDLRRRVDSMEKQSHTPAPGDAGLHWTDHLIISGRGAAAFFSSEENGAYPNDEFRIDEARLRLEAKLGADAYFFTEVNLADRDDDREETWLGDLYVDIENIGQFWDAELPLNVRFGRFDIPFGEEYQYRDAIDNPLITHSLTDFWGIDEGIAFYGGFSTWDYILAVQNGSHPFFNDFNSDKSVTLRIGYQPAKSWRFSVSAMRTGDLDAQGDEMSEMWYGSGFFRGIGAAATNGTFSVELLEANLRKTWSGGHFAAAAGMTWYDDDQPGSREHTSEYISLELAQDITERWYVAGRFSRIESDEGMPLVGLGPFFPDFFSDDLVTEIWRVSLGTGYRISRNLIAKTEYSWEQGDLQSGSELNNRDLLSVQAAYSF